MERLRKTRDPAAFTGSATTPMLNRALTRETLFVLSTLLMQERRPQVTDVQPRPVTPQPWELVRAYNRVGSCRSSVGISARQQRVDGKRAETPASPRLSDVGLTLCAPAGRGARGHHARQGRGGADQHTELPIVSGHLARTHVEFAFSVPETLGP
jgi:hypothetical protein